MRCRYVTDPEIGRVLIPGCMSVAHSDDIRDCSCERFDTFAQYEKSKYNEEVNRLKKIIVGLQDYIETLENATK